MIAKRNKTPRGAQINRCPDCNKFVSLEMADVDEPDLVIDQGDITQGGELEYNFSISGELTIALNCGVCGCELATTEVIVEYEGVLTHLDSCGALNQEGNPHNDPLGVDVITAEAADRTIGKGRYPTHEYGVIITALVSCEECGAETNVEMEEYVAASSFEPA